MSESNKTVDFFSSGPVKWSEIRKNFKGVEEGAISAKDIYRETKVDVYDAIVPDADENSNIPAIDSDEELRTSDFRDTIKEIVVEQSSRNKNYNASGSSYWGSNLDKNVKKKLIVKGQVYSQDSNQPAMIWNDNANNVDIEVTGKVIGTGGINGTAPSSQTSGTIDGQDGGPAFEISVPSDDLIHLKVGGQSGAILGGGGGGGSGLGGYPGEDGEPGEDGLDGADGNDGPVNTSDGAGDSGTGGPGGSGGRGGDGGDGGKGKGYKQSGYGSQTNNANQLGREGTAGREGRSGADAREGRDGYEGSAGGSGARGWYLLQGEPGEPAQSCPSGLSNNQAKDGTRGNSGKGGAQGIQGDTGQKGQDSTAGQRGEDGTPGNPGQDGGVGGDYGQDGEDSYGSGGLGGNAIVSSDGGYYITDNTIAGEVTILGETENVESNPRTSAEGSIFTTSILNTTAELTASATSFGQGESINFTFTVNDFDGSQLYFSISGFQLGSNDLENQSSTNDYKTGVVNVVGTGGSFTIQAQEDANNVNNVEKELLVALRLDGTDGEILDFVYITLVKTS